MYVLCYLPGSRSHASYHTAKTSPGQKGVYINRTVHPRFENRRFCPGVLLREFLFCLPGREKQAGR